jgi:glycosyltransferase involved in cell wall biosynthesis
MTARLLLDNQLQALDEVSWSVVSGDEFDGAPPGVLVEVVPLRREFALSDCMAFFRLWNLFRRQRFDFVQTHTPKASFLALPAARLSGTPAIYTIHGALYFRDNGRKANVLGWLFERWCCAWAHRVLLQSREDQDALPRMGICARAKIRFIGNGIMLDHFLQPVSALRRSSRPIVLMISRLVREKGCADFITLARNLRNQADFVHVGPVELDQRDALSKADIAEASAYVSFVGPVEDVRPYLASSDIVVLPSFREGVPRVPIEAAAAGRPVVAYDVRGVREVVDTSTGVLVARGDVDALTEAVRELLLDGDRRTRLGQAARARVAGCFAEDDVVDRLRDVYAELGARR